jgi:hypothetical protein
MIMHTWPLAGHLCMIIGKGAGRAGGRGLTGEAGVSRIGRS